MRKSGNHILGYISLHENPQRMLTVANTFWVLKTEAGNERIKQGTLTSGLDKPPGNQFGQAACCWWYMFKGCIYHYVRVWESWSLFYFFYRLDLSTIIWIQGWGGKQTQTEINCSELLSYAKGGGCSLHSECPTRQLFHFPVPTHQASHVSVGALQVLGLCLSVSQLQMINSWGTGLISGLNQC